MSWPQLIQLHNSEYSHTYDGAEVRETWYVEPYDSITAFISAVLGQAHVPGLPGGPGVTTFPAPHFLYPWFAAAACEIVPYDPRSFSYMGSTALLPRAAAVDAPGGANLNNILRIQFATSAYKGPNNALNPTQDISEAGIVTQGNTQYSAGAFVSVTYLPTLLATAVTSPPTTFSLQTGLNYQTTPRLRTNVINSGLRLITPAIQVPNLLAGLIPGLPLLAPASYYPESGVAPIWNEEYQELTLERRMLPVTFDYSNLNPYINCTNDVTEQFVLNTAANPGPAVAGPGTVNFAPGCLKFTKYAVQYVEVPSVDNNGEPNGFNRWLNLTLNWDWRATTSALVYDVNGTLLNGVQPVTWNHILAYPGTFSALLNFALAQVPSGLAWYRARYGNLPIAGVGALGAGITQDPYPGVQTIAGPGRLIFDPLTRFF